MTFDKKNNIKFSNLSNEEKNQLKNQLENQLKNLLHNISDSIKKKEISNNEVDKKISQLSGKINNLKTQEQVDDFLNDVKEELNTLKKYSQYKYLFEKFERQVDDFRQKVKKLTQQNLQQLKKKIGVGLTPGEIYEVANQGRQNAKIEIASIVDKLAVEKGGLLGRLAQLANGGDFTKNV